MKKHRNGENKSLNLRDVCGKSTAQKTKQYKQKTEQQQTELMLVMLTGIFLFKADPFCQSGQEERNKCSGFPMDCPDLGPCSNSYFSVPFPF